MPPEFVRALEGLRAQRLRPEVRLTEIPAPARIAPYAVALSGEVASGPADLDDGQEPAGGRFVLLHDPAGQEPWQGTFRVVTLVRASIDPEVGVDPLLCRVAWSWVEEALADLPHAALGGTVTTVHSESFAGLDQRPDEVEVELRVSWTPLWSQEHAGAGEHLEAWATVLCSAAGLPPLPEGVVALGRSL